MSPGDIVCMTSQKRLLPGSSFQEFCDRIKSDGDFEKAARTARAAIEKEQENLKEAGSVLPLYVPSSQCSEVAQFGHEIYSKAGLLSESEVVSFTKKSPKELGLTPFTTEWHSPDSQVSFFVISLVGLEPSQLASIRKIKLYHSVSVRSDKLWLTPATQLSKSQPKDVVKHLANKYGGGKRPSGLMGQSTTSELQSLQDLIELANIIESKRVDLLKQDASGDIGEVEPVGQVVQTDALLEGFGDDDGPSKKKGKKKMPATTKAQTVQVHALEDGSVAASQASRSTTAPPSSQAAMKALPGPASDQGKSETSINSKKSKEKMESLLLLDSDPEMKSVAQLHLSISDSKGRHSSFKSLQHLTVTRFMDSATDHNKGHCLSAVTRPQDFQGISLNDLSDLDFQPMTIPKLLDSDTLKDLGPYNDILATSLRLGHYKRENIFWDPL